MINNEELAKKISGVCIPCTPDYTGSGENDCLYCTKNVAFSAALSMAEEKDKEFRAFLNGLLMQSNSLNIYTLIREHPLMESILEREEPAEKKMMITCQCCGKTYSFRESDINESYDTDPLPYYVVCPQCGKRIFISSDWLTISSEKE